MKNQLNEQRSKGARDLKHVLVISQYFYPEQFRINDICTEWVKRGYKVTVVTGMPNYPQGRFYSGYGYFKKRREVYNGIEIIRLPIIPRGNSSLMLVLNYLSFVISGFVWKTFSKLKADYVFIFEVSPMSQALPGVWYSKKRNIPNYLYVQDLWPENVQIMTGIQNKFIIGAVGKMVDYIYKNCDMIFTTSKSFISAISKRGISEEKIEYWPQYAEKFHQSSDSNVTEIKPKRISGKLQITFAGNIGEAQGLEILPMAAKQLKEQGFEQKVNFNLIGDGRYKAKLVQLIEEKDVSEMFYFIGTQPPEKIPSYMNSSDIAFLSLNDNELFKMTIPAKMQTYMACGMPILATAKGETKLIIEQSKSGLCSDPGNVENLVENIIELIHADNVDLTELGNNALEYSNVNFDKEKLLKRMDRYFLDKRW